MEQICGGLLTLRRRNAANWLRIEECALEVQQRLGQTVQDVFATQKFLSQHPSQQQLMLHKPRLAAGVRLDQQFELREARWGPSELQLRFEKGLPSSINLEFALAEFLAKCDGARTLGELVTEILRQVRAGEDQIAQ